MIYSILNMLTSAFFLKEQIPKRSSKITLNCQHALRTIGFNIFGENGEDRVWDALRQDAAIEAANEPLLASFMHAAILSHKSLENSFAYHMANQLESPTMIGTQVTR